MPSLRVVSLLRSGAGDEAARAVREALQANAHNPAHWRAAGIYYAWQHDWDQARTSFERALNLQDPDQTWWRDVGLALIGSGAPAQACEVFEKIVSGIASQPEAATLVHYGEALELLGRSADAKLQFTRAAALDEKDAAALEGLVRTSGKLSADEEALRFARQAARLRKFSPSSLQFLADAQFQSGDLPGCLRTYRRALRRDPASAEIRSGYLFACLHDAAQTPPAIKHAHEDWFARHGGPPHNGHVFPNTRDSERPLRIGYVSGEFQTSPTQFFLLPLLEAHDRTQFTTYCYHTSRINDRITEAYKLAASHWRDLPGARAERVRDAVLADQIDILVDASGPFYPKVLPLFQMRGAPVQVALPIYPSTTGCREIDYLITDRWTTPEHAGWEAHYSERALWRIPSGYVLYGPPQDAPAVSALPALANGYNTFGLFQRPAKYNHRLWDAVAAILRQTPRSHLLVHYASTDLDRASSRVRARIAQRLATEGIDANRLEFIGRRGVRDHLETIARADIALDTFPYSGHTTTCDALWMGVPVVSLAGITHASRVSAGLLARLGLNDWAVESLDGGYVTRAAEAAQDIPALSALRSTLRCRMAESTICRHTTVARELEAGYREMWRRWSQPMV